MSAAGVLAPTGRLRAAINFGNQVLAQRGPDGAPGGVSVALAQELARELGVPVDLLAFNQAGTVFDVIEADADAWDVAFLAIDPVRAAALDFSPPYVMIEGSYAVAAGSALRSIADVDAEGLRVSVAKGAAYELFLTRHLARARLVRAATTREAHQMLVDGAVEAVAGVKQALMSLVDAHPGLRVIPGRFMAIEQAMCIPKGRTSGLAELRDFVERMKASGMVAEALAASGQGDAAVAP